MLTIAGGIILAVLFIYVGIPLIMLGFVALKVGFDSFCQWVNPTR